jgi:hypothetical protein
VRPRRTGYRADAGFASAKVRETWKSCQPDTVSRRIGRDASPVRFSQRVRSAFFTCFMGRLSSPQSLRRKRADFGFCPRVVQIAPARRSGRARSAPSRPGPESSARRIADSPSPVEPTYYNASGTWLQRLSSTRACVRYRVRTLSSTMRLRLALPWRSTSSIATARGCASWGAADCGCAIRAVILRHDLRS